MDQLFKKIDILFEQRTGCRSRTELKSGKILTVRLGEMIITLLLFPRTKVCVHYAHTDTFYIAIQGDVHLAEEEERLVRAYITVLDRYDAQLAKVFPRTSKETFIQKMCLKMDV